MSEPAFGEPGWRQTLGTTVVHKCNNCGIVTPAPELEVARMEVERLRNEIEEHRKAVVYGPKPVGFGAANKRLWAAFNASADDHLPMSQRWTAIAELATGARMVPKDEADAYASEVERLREALREIADYKIERGMVISKEARRLARAALNASDQRSTV